MKAKITKALFLAVALVLGWLSLAMASDPVNQTLGEDRGYAQQNDRGNPDNDQRTNSRKTAPYFLHHGTTEAQPYVDHYRVRSDSGPDGPRYNPYTLFRW